MTQVQYATSRLTAWLRDYADEKNQVFVDDVKSVLAEVKRLQQLLISTPPCQSCLGNPMVTECAPWCKEAQLLRKG